MGISQGGTASDPRWRLEVGCQGNFLGMLQMVAVSKVTTFTQPQTRALLNPLPRWRTALYWSWRYGCRPARRSRQRRLSAGAYDAGCNSRRWALAPRGQGFGLAEK